MAETWVTGSDGSVTLPSGNSFHASIWTGNFTRHISLVTGFGDGGARRVISSVQEAEGSVSGSPTFDASSTAPGVDAAAPGGALTLQVATGCSYAPTCVFPSFGFQVDYNADNTIDMSWATSSGAAISETWDETP